MAAAALPSPLSGLLPSCVLGAKRANVRPVEGKESGTPKYGVGCEARQGGLVDSKAIQRCVVKITRMRGRLRGAIEREREE